jgi:hypothetical protein
VISSAGDLAAGVAAAGHGHDIACWLCWGLVQLAIPCVLAVRCARVLKAPEVALLGCWR